jgi:CubicO group peptidase (beta-lactamase class C family)
MLAFAVLASLSGCAALRPVDVTVSIALADTSDLVDGDTIAATATGSLAEGRSDEVLVRIEQSGDGVTWETVDESVVAGPEPTATTEVVLAEPGTTYVRASIHSMGEPSVTLATTEAQQVTVHDQREEPSSEALESLTNPASPGCSAAVAVGGEVVWAGAGGLANVATGEVLTTEHRFDIASESKQFTATAILMLQRDGLLALSDPIAKYVPGLPSWGQDITLEQLMHHTSHIPDYWIVLGDWGYGFSTPATQADAIRAIAAEPELDDTQGFAYSNSNYVLLAEVVNRVSGDVLPTFLEERIFATAELEMVLNPIAQGADIAVSHDDNNNPWRSGWAFYGAVGIFTTPTELARWGDEYRLGEIVKEDFSVGAVNGTEEGEVNVGDLYGAGIYIEKDGGLYHLGRIGGYLSKFAISPDRETVVSVMCNGTKADRYGVFDALWEIWTEPKGD